MRRVKKSRNGCARCKSKRVSLSRVYIELNPTTPQPQIRADVNVQVKCGEEKPSCARCLRLGVKCPGYAQSLRWVNKCETLDNQVGDENENENENEIGIGEVQSDRGTTGTTTTTPATAANDAGPSKHDTPKHPELTIAIDSLLQTPLFGNANGDWNPAADSETALVDDPGLCDSSLWDLQGDGSLPELGDLCGQSPVSISGSGSQRGSFDFGSSASVAGPGTELPVSPELSRVQYDFTPESIVRNYPPRHLSPKPNLNLNFMTMSRPLNNPSWTLIEYYFKEVAALFSSYDSQMNPFRSTVSRLWGSSLAMCRTMQSMAAATLVNDFPQFGPLGLKMRDEAAEIISKETVMDDKSLLALLMLGQTASWHNPTDLGISFFNLLRKHLNTMPGGDVLRSSGNDYRFFEEALVYWEMLLSFVADNDAVALSGVNPGRMDESIVLQRVPHPWTGIARDAQFTVQEVGRLVRGERKRVRARKFTSQEDITQAQMAMERGRELEERLLNLGHPSEAEIVSPGDDDTPVWHLLTIAEVYRCTGLMQLYRVFPDLLRRRLPDGVDGVGSEFNGRSSDHAFSHITNGFSLPRTDSNAGQAVYDNWLTEFALTTLSRLKTIPQESRTRCLQPFLLVALSSELRLPAMDNVDRADGEVSAHGIEVSQSRKMVLGRLTSFMHVLPPKPIEVCLRLVREVWRRMDGGETEYWMDVMMERGWETTMG